MPEDDKTLKILEVLLSAEIFNQNENLDVNDLTPEHRVMFGLGSPSVSEGLLPLARARSEGCSRSSPLTIPWPITR